MQICTFDINDALCVKCSVSLSCPSKLLICNNFCYVGIEPNDQIAPSKSNRQHMKRSSQLVRTSPAIVDLRPRFPSSSAVLEHAFVSSVKDPRAWDPFGSPTSCEDLYTASIAS